MPIEFNCHVCGKLLRTADEKAGRTAKCPGCGENLVVPAGEGAADDDDGEDSNFEEYDESSAGDMQACPMCGEQIERPARRCRFCGEDVDDGYSSAPASYQQPHRGTMILVFGILSWFICPIFGIVAWVMANEDLKEMQAGRMDPEGEGLTKAGKIVSIVSLCLNALFLVGGCLLFILSAAAVAA